MQRWYGRNWPETIRVSRRKRNDPRSERVVLIPLLNPTPFGNSSGPLSRRDIPTIAQRFNLKNAWTRPAERRDTSRIDSLDMHLLTKPCDPLFRPVSTEALDQRPDCAQSSRSGSGRASRLAVTCRFVISRLVFRRSQRVSVMRKHQCLQPFVHGAVNQKWVLGRAPQTVQNGRFVARGQNATFCFRDKCSVRFRAAGGAFLRFQRWVAAP